MIMINTNLIESKMKEHYNDERVTYCYKYLSKDLGYKERALINLIRNKHFTLSNFTAVVAILDLKIQEALIYVE